MTVGVVNNWVNLNVEGTITPDAIDCPTILVNGLAVSTAALPQQAAIADATDAPSAITQLNLLLAAMRTLGLIAPNP